ncbi:MAG: hypothetical protein JXR26_00190 [Balneolaceae bacterium]|nr:hypothetical protein [Balneolaceae bacterium]
MLNRNRPANVVRKSTDGWQTVLEGYSIRTLAHNARGQGRDYASGINEARTPFFAASTNFSDDWEIVEMENAAEALFINDMISVMEDGTEVLYFGTMKEVYKYTFEE